MDQELLAIRNNYNTQIGMLNKRIGELTKALQEKTEEITLLLEQKEKDAQVISDLKGKLLVLVSKYVPPQSSSIFDQSKKQLTPLDTPHKSAANEIGEIDKLQTESSGEEARLEEAYENHEKRSMDQNSDDEDGEPERVGTEEQDNTNNRGLPDGEEEHRVTDGQQYSIDQFPAEDQPTEEFTDSQNGSERPPENQVNAGLIRLQRAQESKSGGDEVLRAVTPVPQLMSPQGEGNLNKLAFVVPKKEKIRFLEEFLIVSIPESSRQTIRVSSSTGMISNTPKLTFSYPSTEIT